MLATWSIRNKLRLIMWLLVVVVVTLSWNSIDGLYDYRGLLKNLKRINELPLAAKINQEVSDLRVAVLAEPPVFHGVDANGSTSSPRMRLAGAEIRNKLEDLEQTLERYEFELHRWQDEFIGDSRHEQRTMNGMRKVLGQVKRTCLNDEWAPDAEEIAKLDQSLEGLQSLAGELPGYLHRRLNRFHLKQNDQRRRRLAVLATTSVAAAVLAAFVWLLYRWIFLPLRTLVRGARKVAQGQFDYRIRLDSHDEMAELAGSLNEMSQRFRDIRDDLDRRVQERTRQVVRSEQLASVGRLAADVAHDIDNPLAEIARCAESLQDRLDAPPNGPPAQRETMLADLRRIQDEAFSCKEITQNLLDLSRTGQSGRETVELRQLVQSMIDLVRHMGVYRHKQIKLFPGEHVTAPVNSQEIKQVALNFLTNGLDSIAEGGAVTVEVGRQRNTAEIVFTDDGRGLDEAELTRVFHPASARQRNGQGAGLGLSIAARFVEDHGGHVLAASSGRGRGAQYRVCLPLEREKVTR